MSQPTVKVWDKDWNYLGEPEMELRSTALSFNYRYSGPGSGCGYCKRRFWPSPTQQRKRIVPIHDMPGGMCDGSLTPTVDFAC